MKIDARKITTQEQQEKRNIAIKLRKRGISCKEISKIVEINHTTILRWCTKYKREGSKTLKLGQRGRKIGANKSLSTEEEQYVIRQLTDKNPQQL